MEFHRRVLSVTALRFSSRLQCKDTTPYPPPPKRVNKLFTFSASASGFGGEFGKFSANTVGDASRVGALSGREVSSKEVGAKRLASARWRGLEARVSARDSEYFKTIILKTFAPLRHIASRAKPKRDASPPLPIGSQLDSWQRRRETRRPQNFLYVYII